MTKLSGQIPVPVVSNKQSVALTDLASGPEAFLPENVYLQRINISNGRVLIREKKDAPPLEELRSIELHMNFHRPPVVAIEGSLELGSDPYATLRLDGQWNLDKAAYEFKLTARSIKVPGWLKAYQRKNFLVLDRAALVMDAALKSTQEDKAVFHAKVNLLDALILLNQTQYLGQMNLDAHGLFNFSSKTFDHYSGRLDFVHVDIHRLSKEIDRLDNINGSFFFEPEKLKIHKVSGVYQNVPFEADGFIESYRDLLVKLTVKVNSTIGQMLTLVPGQTLLSVKNFELEGLCQAITSVEGSLRAPGELRKEYKLAVSNGVIRSKDKKILVSGLTADILANDRGVLIRNCKFFQNQQPITLNAFLPKDTDSLGSLEIISSALRFTSPFRLQDNALLLKGASFVYEGLSARFDGTLTDLTNPLLHIQGTMDLNLEKIAPLAQEGAARLKDLKLRGWLTGLFTYTGAWNNPIAGEFKMDGRGDPVFVKQNFRLGALEYQLRLNQKLLKIPYLRSTVYGGTLTADATLDLSRKEVPFDSRISLTQLKINELARDLDLKPKDLAGVANLRLSLGGVLNRPETFTGNGALDIREGRLWQTDLFKQMGQLPFVKVEGLDVVVFHDLAATFTIHDQKLWTRDLSVFSETVDLSLDGSIGFDQTLDMSMGIRFSNDIIRGAYETGGLVPLVVTEAEDFISQYKITGTLKQPKYEKMGLPVGRVIGKKISNIFQTLTS